MNNQIHLETSTINHNKDVICEALSDGYFLYLNTLNAHWNIEGRNFISLHTLLEEQYEQLKNTVDELAERMRMLGLKAPADHDTFYKNSKLNDNKIMSEYSGQMELQIELLCNSYSKAIAAIRNNIAEVAKTNDYGTEDLLISVLKQYEKNFWMLNSHISSNNKIISNQEQIIDNYEKSS